jgi:hypothetical protein
MGSGKTTAAIRYMNESSEDVRFLYITPFLTEVERIISSCPEKNFCQPKEKGGKLNNIKKLFEQGKNIVSTHALFQKFDNKIIKTIRSKNYVLIMDEVADVVQPIDISGKDLHMLLNNCTEVQKNGTLRWTDDEYTGVFQKYRRMCDMGAIGMYGKTALLWLLPIKAFEAFKDVYILTYMFSAQLQRYYYDYHGLKYTYMYVAGDSFESYRFSNTPEKCTIPDYKSLIHIIKKEKINSVGDERTALSMAWYAKNSKNASMTQLKNNASNYFHNIIKAPSKQVMWTTFEDWRPEVTGKGYSKGFLACNARATNDHRDKIAVAYLVNRYFSPVVKNFFAQNKVKVEEDRYALSEMLQWIWRSAIRDGKEIWVYIPSSRMRKLLINWLESEVK